MQLRRFVVTELTVCLAKRLADRGLNEGFALEPGFKVLRSSVENVADRDLWPLRLFRDNQSEKVIREEVSHGLGLTTSARLTEGEQNRGYNPGGEYNKHHRGPGYQRSIASDELFEPIDRARRSRCDRFMIQMASDVRAEFTDGSIPSSSVLFDRLEGDPVQVALKFALKNRRLGAAILG